MLSHFCIAQRLTHQSLKIRFNIIFHIFLNLSCFLALSHLPMLSACPVNLTVLNYMKLIIFGKSYKLLNSYNFLHSRVSVVEKAYVFQEIL